jgi:RNA polymerase sigma-70 factor (ECF subfamily)
LQKSDEVLVEETRKGNKKSFELLILKYEKPIFNLIFQYAKDREIVADLAQETFLKAYRALASFKGNSTFYTWLRRIAINNSINYLNARRDHPTTNDEPFENQTQTLADTKFVSPENTVLVQELSYAVRNAMDSLPDSFRSILIMREFEEMSYEEIAGTLNCPVGTVRSRLFHARRILKEKLEPYM